MQSCLVSKPIEFDGIKIWIVQLLPHAQIFYGATWTQPVLDNVVCTWAAFYFVLAKFGSIEVVNVSRDCPVTPVYVNAARFFVVHIVLIQLWCKDKAFFWIYKKKCDILNEITLRAERCSAPCCAAESREVSSRQQGGEWRLAGKVLAVRMFIFSFAPTKIELIHSILERYINICPYFPPTLPLHCSYRPPTNPLLFCIFSTTSRVWYYRLASFYVRIISEIL